MHVKIVTCRGIPLALTVLTKGAPKESNIRYSKLETRGTKVLINATNISPLLTSFFVIGWFHTKRCRSSELTTYIAPSILALAHINTST